VIIQFQPVGILAVVQNAPGARLCRRPAAANRLMQWFASGSNAAADSAGTAALRK
jgi:hypothetical protein